MAQLASATDGKAVENVLICLPNVLLRTQLDLLIEL